MSLLRHIRRLADAQSWTYGASPNSSAEPAAWAALALIVHGETVAALRPALWLAELQQDGGAVGISATEDEPRWPTSLAMLAWSAWDRAAGSEQFAAQADRAAQWALGEHGETSPRSSMIGHDTTLTGWSWAAKTHSWLEPTCFFILGLRAGGYDAHPRTVEGVALVRDRLLPSGGANYGNTIVLGQSLLPHVQPTGLAMWALTQGTPADPRIEKSLRYLEDAISPSIAPASLGFACLGLTAHGRRPRQADAWCDAALNSAAGPPLSTYEQSLLLLAARADFGWLPGAVQESSARLPARQAAATG